MATATKMDFRDFAREVGTITEYVQGDILFNEGDEALYMYVVLSGAIEVSSHNKVIETVTPGNAVGILSLLDGDRRTVTARASAPTQAALINRKKFRYMLDEMPHFGRYVIGELAHRLRTTNAAL